MNTAFQPSGNEVKRAALTEHRRSGNLGRQQTRVMRGLVGRAFATRQQLAIDIDMPINSVCGRVTELLDVGYVYVAGMTVDKPARQMLALTEKGKDALRWADAREVEHA